MATIFQAFRASEMPKRLLRYALSRLELLDADALDLDNLDFAWGRNTVLEFRDVGIRLEKLERLLKLPDPITILKAKVTLLRATIPVNFYTSPIIIEVNNVQVQLKIASKNKGDAGAQRKAHGDSDSEIVPNTVDLAQSFLQTQPLAEKQQLEEALLAETHDLGASVEISDSEDDDLAYGTGQALTLPTFMADFLQGIVDRVQVRIQGVTFKVDVEVPVDPSASTLEVVTFELNLDSIDVEGITSPSLATQVEEEPQRIVPRAGKRHISLNKVRAFLISEANVFSTLARSPSSLATHSPVSAERSVLSREPSELSKLARSIPLDPLEESGILDQSQHSVDAFDIPYDLDELGSDPEDDTQHSLSSTPRASICEPAELRRDGPPAMSAVINQPPRWTSPEEGAHSAPGLLPISHTAPMEASKMSNNSSRSGSMSDEPPSAEDLTKSHVFTHEEAESMYYSAFSEMGGVPGGWHSEDESSKHSDLHMANSISHPQSLNQSQEDKGPEEEIAHGNIGENETIDSAAGTISAPPMSPAKPEPLRVLVPNQDEADEDGVGPAQNEMETPRGPTKLVKEILSLDSVSIYVPSTHKHLELSTADFDYPGLEKSASPNMPGTFSVHTASVHSESQAEKTDTPKVLHTSTHHSDGSIEVDLSPLEVRFDMSIGFLLVMVVSTLVDALKGPAEEPPQAIGVDETARSPPPEVKVNAQKICLNFMEKLAGVADTPGRIFELSPVTLAADVLLTTCLQGLKISTSTTASLTTTQIDLEKFTFGYTQDPILSFNKQMQLQASITDAVPSPGADISVKIESSSKATRCVVYTLPLLVQLDLLRIDETFSWFGGLSSFLNIGSSVTSNASPTTKTAAKPLPVKRGVRFQDEPEETPASATKVDVRIGGLRLDVIGKDCSVALDSTAVKIASRGGIVGVGISRMRLTGPFTRYSRDPPITAELGNTRVEYQNSPNDEDLERLLRMITPSVFKFDDKDEIMVDTLLRQRRKGPVLRVKVGNGFIKGKNLAALSCLSSLADDFARLGSVAKYLPEDERPGLLTFAKIESFNASLDCGGKVGKFKGSLKDLEVAHTTPLLIAFGVGGVNVYRNDKEELLGSSETSPREPSHALLPVLMVRIIGDEIEPVIKVKLRDLRVEYRVPTIMDFLDLTADATPQDFEAAMAASVANLAEHAHAASTGKGKSPTVKSSSNDPRRTRVNVTFRDCIIGLNPLNIPSRMLVVLTDSSLDVLLPKDENMKIELNVAEARLLLIDDTTRLGELGDIKGAKRRISEVGPGPQVQELAEQGYVSVLEMKSAKVVVDIQGSSDGDEKFVTVHVVNDPLIVLETCADSTQTLITLANSLAPPTPKSKEIKYRTNAPLIKDLLSSISPEAFGKAEGDYDFDQDFGTEEILRSLQSSQSGDIIDSNYLDTPDLLFDAAALSGISDPTSIRDTADGVLLTNEDSSVRSEASSDMVIEDFYFGDPNAEGTVHKWNSARGAYDEIQTKTAQRSPLKVCIRGAHIIWHLFDGYDWEHTKEIITKAIEEIETKMWEIRNPRYRRESAGELDMEEPDEITDCLFNSIYIGIPTNHDPRELTANINQALRAGDNETETESVATTQWTAAPSAVGGYRPKGKRPKLGRSKTHKITFELGGVCLDLVTFPPGSGETQNSIDIRVRDLTVFDHIPTSTWKKFLTYDFDREKQREIGSNMVHISLLNVKPVEGLAASEIVLRAKVLPLRLHVDQDALDFITRFFEFKDDTVPVHASESDVPFLQRVEVDDIPVTLDFKPKRVDYGGLRSGKTTEFMNFIVLDQSRMVLRHVILYGIKGFDKMGETLNSIWTADVKANQLPGVLAGLAPARSLVNLGSGFKDLVEVPIREYKKDGRIIRSIGKGAFAFARKTGTEAIKLGAKLAIGTQYMLQGAEELLGNKPQGTSLSPADPELDEEKKQISLYADQPSGVRQGLRRAYDSLSRDIAYTKDVIIGIPTDIADSRSATGMAKTVLGKAPVIILRPAIGAAKATGQLMLGVTNTVDPENKRRVDEKYKH